MDLSDLCVCSDCGEQDGHIEKIEGEVYASYFVTEITKAHEKLNLWEGDECEVDHTHSQSKSCELKYQCVACSEVHEYESDAEECCEGWECNHCGSVFTGSSSWYGNAKDQANSCCMMECDDCGNSAWPYEMENHRCAAKRTVMNQRRALPWEERGIKVDARKPAKGNKWGETWGFDFKQFNVVRAAADYYLLEAISAGLVGTTDGRGNVNSTLQSSSELRIIRNEASALLDQLCQLWDPVLQAYTHMAVGGELRHHTAVGGAVVSTNRDSAWSGWKDIFEAVGPQALADAAELFLEFPGGAFGGKPWADASLILHKRLTGQLNSRMFLDRIFNAQHNGGCLLNKVTWLGDTKRGYFDDTTTHANIADAMGLGNLTYNVLPAHGAEPEPMYETLLAYASREVRALFNDSYLYAGHAAKARGVSLTFRCVIPTPADTEQQSRFRSWKKGNSWYQGSTYEDDEPDFDDYDPDYDDDESCSCCSDY